MLEIERISAITLAVRDMARAAAFYETLGFRLVTGGSRAAFTTFAAGRDALNLIATDTADDQGFRDRVIFHVADVDTAYRAITAAGLQPDFAPRDAAWGERYFHVTDPDGHELSFAKPLPG